MLAIAGSLAAKKIVPASAGTFPTTAPLFVGLLVGVILIVGGLTFFPALALGPIVEHFAMHAGTLLLNRSELDSWTPRMLRKRTPVSTLLDPTILVPGASVDAFAQARPAHAGQEPGDVRGRGRARR